MNCPYCQDLETKVIDSRLSDEGLSIRRRRRCEGCQKRFTTYERIEITMPMVVKSDGRREDYSREKILEGIRKACQKRAIPVKSIEMILDQIEKSLVELNDKEVTSTLIGQLVMRHLKGLDPVAYVRFASVYRTFQDIDEFVSDLKNESHKQGPEEFQ